MAKGENARGENAVLRPNKLLYSIRWRFVIIYLLLVAIVFGIISVAVSSIVSNYMLDQRMRDQLKRVSSISVQAAPYLEQADATELYNIVTKSYKDIGGRMLILNDSGIVQTDSFSELNGIRLSLNEIDDILYGQNASSFGYHKIEEQPGGASFWALYCAAPIISNGSVIGVVLYSSYIQDVVDAMEGLQIRMLWIYVLACVIIIISSMILTRFITKPVKQLTDVALKISAGDLKSRAKIKGKSEIAELGQTFNMMCDRLQNIDQQRSEFVSDASHELKTPLASMKILVESLLYQDHVQEEVYKEFLSDINGEIDRLNSLITDLLLLSKMDSDILAINIERVLVKGLINKCVAALKPIAHKRGVTVRMHMADESLEVSCDPLKLRQAVNNLIENAIKYSKENGHVDISVARQGQELSISIEDDGVGMKEEHLHHIFERFYRVDKARSRETGGTGLGLHIVRRIALMHGGRVEVTSREGVGSKFTLILPLAPARSEESGAS